MGDPDYWKNYYASDWSKHKNETEELKTILETQYPKLKNSIKIGYGADSSEFKDYDPKEFAKPSLMLYKERSEKCAIWTTGSYKNIGKADLWVRPDKLEQMKFLEGQGVKTWVYLRYPNNVFILECPDVEKHLANITTANPKAPEEKYISIPQSEAKSPDMLFKWIEQNI